MSEELQHFRIAEIEVAKSVSDEAIVGVFRFENPGRPRQGPTLLVVADIHSTLYAYERLLDVINATVEQMRFLVSQVEQDPLGRFEKLVQRLNEAIADFMREEATPFQWSRINIFVMELSEGHLCFTGTGRLMNVFLQKQPDGTFRNFDLLGSLEQPAQVESTKPFASIICGDIGIGDVLIVGTNNFERLRSDLKLADRLATLPPVTAAMEIKQDLERRSIPDDFVAVIVSSFETKPTTAQLPFKPATPEVVQDVPTASVQKLQNAAQEAEQRLAPAGSSIKRLSDVSSGFKSLLGKAVGLLGVTRRWIMGLLSRKGRVKDPVALASLRGLNAGYRSMLTKKHKTIIWGAAIALVCIIVGLAWWSHARKVAAETAAWNATYDSAMDQRNRAESDLVYGNELRARSEIDGSEKIIQSLQTKVAERQARLQKIETDLNTLRERLKKVVKTDNVTELYGLPASVASGSLSAALLTGDNAYVADQSAREIVKISITTKETKHIKLPDGGAPVVSATEGKDSILFATADGKLLALNKSTDLLKPLPWSHAKTSSTIDAVLYTSKLYRLDPPGNQVWRSVSSGGGYGSETAYIKATDVTISDAVSLAIDSNVYILKSDGTLLQFLSGGQVGFSLPTIDPPLRAASSLWTSTDSTLLVITDPAEKRVLVFDKNGTLKAQITSTQFRALRNVYVDETAKRIALIDDNRLILVPLP